MWPHCILGGAFSYVFIEPRLVKQLLLLLLLVARHLRSKDR